MSSDRVPHPKPQPKKKSIMRSLGEFVGHVWWGVRTDPSQLSKPDSSKRILERTVREEHRGDITLRETTVREIEYRAKSTDESDRGE